MIHGPGIGDIPYTALIHGLFHIPGTVLSHGMARIHGTALHGHFHGTARGTAGIICPDGMTRSGTDITDSMTTTDMRDGEDITIIITITMRDILHTARAWDRRTASRIPL